MRILALTIVLAACHPQAPPEHPAPGARFELVESAPSETTLDHADLPNADVVWTAMFDGARTSIDLGEFYAISHEGSRLETVIASLEAAAARGVKVRFLIDAGFGKKYPQVADRLAAQANVEVRRLDLKSKTGGVLHAKYFVVDGREVYVGSQNFDWRSLEHIQELGFRCNAADLVSAVREVFEYDWAIAGGAAAAVKGDARAGLATYGGETVKLRPAFSPRGLLPDERTWDLPQIVGLIDRGKASVSVQLLTYRAGGRDDKTFDDLDDALRRAAARGVKVRLLVADWAKRKHTLHGLQELAKSPVEVGFVTIPAHSSGPISYARVVHAKYVTVDGESAWVGTSNWERDYFYGSRNLGVVVFGKGPAQRLRAFFDEMWSGPYVERVDPAKAYTAPAIGEGSE